VAAMVDCFVLLTLAAGGDSLQGIKQGVLELADVVAVNKADMSPPDTRRAARELAGALRLLRGPSRPPVLPCSALTGDGLDEVWAAVLRHQDSVPVAERRAEQQVDWTWSLVRTELAARLRDNPAVTAIAPDVERRVRSGELTPSLGAAEILRALG
jgi:GTPase